MVHYRRVLLELVRSALPDMSLALSKVFAAMAVLHIAWPVAEAFSSRAEPVGWTEKLSGLAERGHGL